jgi:hypothetical protein
MIEFLVYKHRDLICLANFNRNQEKLISTGKIPGLNGKTPGFHLRKI